MLMEPFGGQKNFLLNLEVNSLLVDNCNFLPDNKLYPLLCFSPFKTFRCFQNTLIAGYLMLIYWLGVQSEINLYLQMDHLGPLF